MEQIFNEISKGLNDQYEEIKESHRNRREKKRAKTNEQILAQIWTNEVLNDHIKNDLFKLWQSDYYLTDKERG